MWLLAFPFWYTFDDHLAEALGTPGLGALPVWVVPLAAATLHGVTSPDLSDQFGKVRREIRKLGKDS